MNKSTFQVTQSTMLHKTERMMQHHLSKQAIRLKYKLFFVYNQQILIKFSCGCPAKFITEINNYKLFTKMEKDDIIKIWKIKN